MCQCTSLGLRYDSERDRERERERGKEEPGSRTFQIGLCIFAVKADGLLFKG